MSEGKIEFEKNGDGTLNYFFTVAEFKRTADPNISLIRLKSTTYSCHLKTFSASLKI